MNLRVTTTEQAIEFVKDVGVCFLFPIQGVEMPALWDAIAGSVVKTINNHSGYEIERTRGWKDDHGDWLALRVNEPSANIGLATAGALRSV